MDYLLGFFCAVGMFIVGCIVVAAFRDIFEYVIDKITCPSCRKRKQQEREAELGKLLRGQNK